MLRAMLFLVLIAAQAPRPASEWKTLEPGLEIGWLTATHRSAVGDSRIAIVRIDPAKWDLELVTRSQTGDATGHTAREWAQGRDLVAVINAGMFATDFTTHLGYMEARGRVYTSSVNSYQSVAAFDPRAASASPEPAAPAFHIFDLDEPGVTLESIRRRYGALVQNLRLIKRPGENRWSASEKRWSEAALGEDGSGRILFVFCRSPFSMRDLDRELLSAGLGIVALQHLEGGPEAQLYLEAGGVELELFGSYETAFREDDGNDAAWPIPNVLGVRRKSAAH